MIADAASRAGLAPAPQTEAPTPEPTQEQDPQ